MSSSQSYFYCALNVTTYRGNEWSNVNNITNSFNTYPCSFILSTNLTKEDMDRRLGGVSVVKSGNKTIADIGAHNMDPNYGTFL